MRIIDADSIRQKAVPHTRVERAYCADIKKWAVLVSDIDEAPSVDAVEVVRCKDCKFSDMYCFGSSSQVTLACLDIEEDGFIRAATAVPPDFFCANGERRSE